MPVKIKDAEGNEVEVFTQEDVDNALATKLQEQEQKLTEGFQKTLEEYEFVPDDNKGQQKPPEQKQEDNEPPAWFKPYADRVDRLAGNQSEQYIDGVLTGLDADKQKTVREKFGSMTGYEDTPQGLQQRANDAYLLVTGERPQEGGVDMTNLHASGGGRSEHTEQKYSEADKEIQKTLGVTEEDVKKYGSNQSA